MEILPIGTKVGIGPQKEIIGTIIGICIRGRGYLTYEVQWWDGRTKKEDWFHEDLVKAKEDRLMRIGFKHE